MIRWQEGEQSINLPEKFGETVSNLVETPNDWELELLEPLPEQSQHGMTLSIRPKILKILRGPENELEERLRKWLENEGLL